MVLFLQPSRRVCLQLFFLTSQPGTPQPLSRGVWGYTLAAWPLQYDMDNDDMLDSAEQNMAYNAFKPRVHPSVPIGLADGHAEAVDYESLWETYSDGDPVHDFWWDASCSDPRAE